MYAMHQLAYHATGRKPLLQAIDPLPYGCHALYTQSSLKGWSFKGARPRAGRDGPLVHEPGSSQLRPNFA